MNLNLVVVEQVAKPSTDAPISPTARELLWTKVEGRKYHCWSARSSTQGAETTSQYTRWGLSISEVSVASAVFFPSPSPDPP